MAVFITYNETLAFGGTFDPAFILKIVRSRSTSKSILQLILLQDCLDRINPTLNEEYSREFAKFIEANLNIPKDRGYIGFSDPGRAYLGYVKFQSGLSHNFTMTCFVFRYNGTTFETIFAGK
jgi:hypothetical protein